MNLPEQYIENMKRLLGEKEFQQYLNCFEQKKYTGIRINTLKWNKEQFLNKKLFETEEVAWCNEGYYCSEKVRPAKHLYYAAGLYYIQEPSAMSAAAILPVNEGECVLDICAAPGGKSTQLGTKLKQTGVLVCNDISASRTKALLKNIECFGITNSIVMSETPQKLSKHFEQYFDKILIDAPCSGEGMFRKDSDMIKKWNSNLIAHCMQQQKEILQYCAIMLKAGGMMLYSTCTFSPEENEHIITEFLQYHKEFKIVPIEAKWGFQKGMIEGCVRLFPHKIKGEGHFLALLQKQEECANTIFETEKEQIDKRMSFFWEFEKQVLKPNWQKTKGIYKIYGDDLCYIPENVPMLKGLRVLRSGLQLGTFKKNRFEPSHAFALALNKNDVNNYIDFDIKQNDAIRYLKGESISIEQQKEGWCIICVDGYTLGWAKVQKGRLKNKYPVSWKWE
ncbi:RsmB/NOP family class I SAM-dependent RNA methyltransferase [Clostridium sp. MD294]|uniref:RsmF rRNA methyltransferase first C-terminal domain-containing protein n=1 Tax=Clostridium sp. MD294 TaxID=97138 RepID=UPI0002CA65E1|nr:RsmB/NOP family class I SAM-dependent RNA methyltransferase [Clostridium sp. MD294]NDO46092.1 SAM-dependent methyltransferase [Clostridium sp. MD294]USF30242.1 Ribosomal RNA small subunit methyltransferase F [Clostridium sp. MD294]